MSGENSRWFNVPKTDSWKQDRSIEMTGAGNSMYGTVSPGRKAVQCLNIHYGIFSEFECIKHVAIALNISRTRAYRLLKSGDEYNGLKFYYSAAA